MRWLKFTVGLAAVVAVAALAEEARQTRRELARLTELVSAQKPPPAPVPPPAPTQAGAEPHPDVEYTLEPPDIVEIDFRLAVGATPPDGTESLRGKHMVHPDGTVGLGLFGPVTVAGETVAAAEALVRRHLAKYVFIQDATVRVAEFNSKRFYVITDCDAGGEQVVPHPCNGNDTVQSVVASLGPTQKLSANEARTVKAWVARRATNGADQVLPVDWVAITQRGEVGTDYAIRHGDRVYVKSVK